MHPSIEKLSDKAHPALCGVIGLAVLAGAYGMIRSLQNRTALFQMDLLQLLATQEQSTLTMNHYLTLADLKAQDVAQFKEGMANLAQSNKALF